ncbi:response regulator [Polynucleobacter cosmopolitanus]|uniref:DNA-binding response regulator n=1 Tax=Polynucleobacter cosmopolitanus TaxID=351345 RepID=A0A229FUB0_9BURK|nr:response regulator transcription factor [Polynucleobacter cosmopolitanus]OXL15575.1 DNA-binding response regulator [Polynucleobacter cosmopolitanus]
MNKRAVIIDDHVIIRQSLKALINTIPDLEAMAEGSNPAGILEICEKNQPDILLMDISFPEHNGIDFIKNIKKYYPKISILVVSTHPEQLYALKAIKAGASGYINKSQALEDYLTAVEMVLEGKNYINPAVSQLMSQSYQDGGSKDGINNLSTRELQTLQLLASSLTVTKIAEKLNLSVKTVSMYRSRLLAKLNLQNNSELILFAIKNKIVD